MNALARWIGIVALMAAGAGCVVSPGKHGVPPRHPLLIQAEQTLLQGDLERALAEYRGYRAGFGGAADPFVGDCHYWEGTIHLEQGRHAEAEASFRACLAFPPRDEFLAVQASIGLGDVHFLRDRYRDAFEGYRRAIERADAGAGATSGARLDYALYRAGVSLQRLGAFKEGRAVLARCLREHPRSPLRPRVEAHLAYGGDRFHIQAGAFDDVLEAQRQSARANYFGYPAQVFDSKTASARYRVWVGEYATYAAAAAEADRVKALLGDAQLVP